MLHDATFQCFQTVFKTYTTGRLTKYSEVLMRLVIAMAGIPVTWFSCELDIGKFLAIPNTVKPTKTFPQQNNCNYSTWLTNQLLFNK